ncbi:MAG: DMT family transporter [Oceanipulchritudo sp.]
MGARSPESGTGESFSPGKKDPTTGTTLVFLSASGFVFLWNSGFIGAEYVLPNVAPLTLLFWRYWALCLILGIYLAIRKRLFWPGGQMVTHACLLGVFAHGTWLACVTYALQFGVPAGLVALIVALQPLLTGALAGLMAREPISRLQWLGTVIGFGGVLITVGVRVDFGQPVSVFAYLLPFGSVLAITLASLLERRRVKFQDPDRIPLGLSLFYQALGTALVVSLPALFFEGLETRADVPFVLAMLWLVFGVSLGAYGLMWHLLSRLDATREASLFYLGPPVTMLMAWAAFGDTVTRWDLFGLLTVAVGVSLATLRR